MRYTRRWVSLLVVLGLLGPAWAADDKKDSETKSPAKDYKTEFKDYIVVNKVQGELTKVDKDQGLKIKVTVARNKHTELEVPTLENVQVFWVHPPVELDDKGKPKKVSPKDRKKPVTGPGNLKGYPAEFSDLKEHQIVLLVLMQKKESRRTAPKDKTEMKPSVGGVYIVVAEPRS